jgi:hypothetical protein
VHKPLDILLFTADPARACGALAAGVSGVVVDWETRACDPRRAAVDVGAPDSPADLRAIASVAHGRPVYCRVNRPGPHTPTEVACALEGGATHLIVPMIERPDEAGQVMDLVRGRAAVGIMIETELACRALEAMAAVPVDFVYVGLLDLAIGRREGNPFRALVDGTADRVREAFAGIRFGIGGVTAVDAGCPVPAIDLLGELARLDADFAFARRSFLRDTAGRDVAVEVARIGQAWQALRGREAAQVAADHARFAREYGASRPVC